MGMDGDYEQNLISRFRDGEERSLWVREADVAHIQSCVNEGTSWLEKT